jgi:fructokinase
VGEASGFIKAPGGAPANVAVAVERLGHEAAFIGQVGEDPFGRYLAEVLHAEGVDLRGLKFTTQARTALAFVSLQPDGERSFAFYRNPSADMLMTAEDVNLDVIDDGKIFHFGSITLIDEPVRSATLRAAQYAHSKGLLMSYDPNLRLSLWPNEAAARQGMLTGLAYAHIVKVNDEEVEFLTGSGDVSSLWREQIQIIVVTHGAKGSTVYTRDQRSYQEGYPVDTVDTTGAGDAFVAGMLVGILEHWGSHVKNIESIFRFANAVGALATTHKGAIPALPMRAQVDAFLRVPR